MKENITVLTKVFFICFIVNSSAISQTLPFQNDYALGLDLSFVKQSEDRGTKYYDEDGTEKPVLQIFRQHGYNWSRIMICNEPVNHLAQDLEYVVEAAKATKEYNYFFLLDMMFTNGWANPMIQPTPSLWVDMSHRERVEAVYEYVHKVVSRLKAEGVMPDMIQVGNEIGNGFLWPDGRINYAKPEDGSCTFKAGVSGENLLLAINVIDQQIIFEGPTQDHVEIYYLDLSSGRRKWYSGGTISLPAQLVHGKIEGLSIRAGRRKIPIDNSIKSYYKKSQSGYVMELSVPFQALGFDSAPAKGNDIGFEVILTNAVKEGNNEYQIQMSGTGSETGYLNTVFNRFEME